MMQIMNHIQERRAWRKTDEYKIIRKADCCFLSCILFEAVGIFTMPFLGILGAQMAIYSMTFLYAFFLADGHKKDTAIPYAPPKAGVMAACIGLTVCGIPVAMLLNFLAGLMIGTPGGDMAGNIIRYPLWLALTAFSVVPAIVEEYVFRGLILGEYLKIETRAAVLLSSLFFALLHFSPGTVLYGFFFGCVFALVRTATGNLVYSTAMHMFFNAVNVLLSYKDLPVFPAWAGVVFMAAGMTGFLLLGKIFFQKTMWT